MDFSIQATDGKARACSFQLAHGIVETPIFMPVGTQGAIKGLDSVDIHVHLQASIILANTYHLYLRPGIDVLKQRGGIHAFANFYGNYLTDSGGFQAFSLGGNAEPNDCGIAFKSHIDGSSHFFSPQKVLDIEYAINSDIMMILDDVVGLPATKKRLTDSVSRTTQWAMQSMKYHIQQQQEREVQNKIFAIMQGGIDYEMRKKSAEELVALEFDGYAIGGLAVGESHDEMYECLDYACDLLPITKPRYLMGVGTPENLLESIDRGVDMFDCVMPTRNARNATIFTHNGKIHIKKSRYKLDTSPLDSKCTCFTCKNFARDYLHHLFRSNEISYHRLASLHNLHFYLTLMRQARKAIFDKNWQSYKRAKIAALKQNI